MNKKFVHILYTEELTEELGEEQFRFRKSRVMIEAILALTH